MKTAIYIRVSTQEQAKEGYSIPHQKEKLFKYCQAMNWQVVEIYADEGISGSTIEKDLQQSKCYRMQKKDYLRIY